MAELSSLQIRYHHWIAIGFGIAETVQGLFKIVVKFEEKSLRILGSRWKQTGEKTDKPKCK